MCNGETVQLGREVGWGALRGNCSHRPHKAGWLGEEEGGKQRNNKVKWEGRGAEVEFHFDQSVFLVLTVSCGF